MDSVVPVSEDCNAVPPGDKTEPSQVARSRRSGILLTAGAVGYMITFALIGRFEPDARIAMSFGAIPLALGVGYFLDAFLVRRDLTTS